MEQRKVLSKKLRKIFVNLYGDNMLSQEFDIFDAFDKGFLDENTMRRYLAQYGKKDLTLLNLL